MAREISNGAILKGGLQLAAGTTSLSPLTLQSGTSLTAATAGAMEYDGNLVYLTPNATAGRAFLPSTLIYRLNANLAGGTGTAAQKVLGVGITLPASTIYEFEYLFTFTKTAGTTGHSVSLNFGGTATFNNALHSVVETSTNTAGTTAALQFVTSMGSTISYNMGSTASVSLTAIGRGTVSVNATGTLIPQFTLSANPGAAYSTIAGSYLALWPIGASGANTSVGAWS